MKTELRAKTHEILPGQTVFEVWHDGEFIATIAGEDGPGVRVISKHPLSAALFPGPLNVVAVVIRP